MHNTPQQPLDELETLRKENERIKTELADYKKSELELYGDLSCLLKFIGTETETGKPAFIGSPTSIHTILRYAKEHLDASSRLDKQYTTKEDALFLEPDPALE